MTTVIVTNSPGYLSDGGKEIGRWTFEDFDPKRDDPKQVAVTGSSGPYAKGFQPEAIKTLHDFYSGVIGANGRHEYTIEGAVVDKTGANDRLAAVISAARKKNDAKAADAVSKAGKVGTVAMSDADKTYIADMNDVHVAANKVARAFLAADTKDRNPVLLDMARQSIVDHAEETAKMEAMSGDDQVSSEDSAPKQGPKKMSTMKKGDDEITLSAEGDICKADEEQQVVYGYAYVTHDKDGEVMVDKSGDFVDDIAEIEKTAIKFMMNSRAGDTDHNNTQSTTIVESMVFTPEKTAAMGIEKGLLPSGWWIGAKCDDATWAGYKAGKWRSFSIHGRGLRSKTEPSS